MDRFGQLCLGEQFSPCWQDVFGVAVMVLFLPLRRGQGMKERLATREFVLFFFAFKSGEVGTDQISGRSSDNSTALDTPPFGPGFARSRPKLTPSLSSPICVNELAARHTLRFKGGDSGGRRDDSEWE